MGNNLRPAVTFNHVNKLVDTFNIYLDGAASLNMYIDLSMSTKDNERIPVVREFSYKSNYNNQEYNITIKRRFTPYLSFDYPDSNEVVGKGQVRIYYTSILGVIDKIEEVEKLLNNAFMSKRGKLIINNPFEIVSMPSPSTSITFTPVIYTDQNDNQMPGVNMVFNNSYSVSMGVDKFEGIRYIFRTCDLYGWASTYLSSYTGDLLGMNTMDMDGSYKRKNVNLPQDDVPEGAGGVSMHKRISNGQKETGKSFFDD